MKINLTLRASSAVHPRTLGRCPKPGGLESPLTVPGSERDHLSLLARRQLGEDEVAERALIVCS